MFFGRPAYGIMRLFELRGWRIGNDHGRAFDLEDDQRRLSVVVMDGARKVPAEDPSLVHFFADGGYAGQKLAAAIAHVDRLAIEIIRRSGAGC